MLDGILTTLRNPRFKTAAAWLAGGAALGAVALLSVDGVVNATNTPEFCSSCHEMRHSVLPEYQTTVHYANAFGVRATCADCHVPRDWPAKLVHKIGSINEIYHWALGTIDTPEKFEAHRAELAAKVWAEMKTNDSAQCRHCHSVAAMDGARQNAVARAVHPAALKAGSTCIDCHKGIAHKLPDAKKVAATAVAAPAPAAPVAAPAAPTPAAQQPRLAATNLPAPTPSTTQAPAKTPHPAVTNSAACLTCHKGVTDQPIRPGQSPDPTKKHPVGIRDGVDCIICHKTPGQIPGQ